MIETVIKVVVVTCISHFLPTRGPAIMARHTSPAQKAVHADWNINTVLSGYRGGLTPTKSLRKVSYVFPF